MVKLRRAILFAKDLHAMTAFYRDAVGLAFLPEHSNDGWAELDAGGARLALHAIPAAIAAGIEILTPPRRREETPIKLSFEVSDLAAARARLADSGISVPPPTRWRSCEAVDPEGNVFQLVEAADLSKRP